METADKVLLTICFIFSLFALAITVDIQNEKHKLESRLLILETRVNIYSGNEANNN